MSSECRTIAFAPSLPLHCGRQPRCRIDGVVLNRKFVAKSASCALKQATMIASSTKSSPVLSLPSVAALSALLRGNASSSQTSGDANESPGLVVVKMFAGYCRACLGVAPRFKKTARCFLEQVGGDRVTFAEMDYQENVTFCRDELGVQSLPFFAIFRKGEGGSPRLVEGHVLPWNKLSVLDKRVTELLEEEGEVESDGSVEVAAKLPGTKTKAVAVRN